MWHSIAMKAVPVIRLAGAQGARILGFGIMQYRDAAAHLTLFAVHPGHQHRGLGRRLVAWLEKRF